MAPPRVGHVPSLTPDTVAEARYSNSNFVSCGLGTSHVIPNVYAYEGHVLMCSKMAYLVTVVAVSTAQTTKEKNSRENKCQLICPDESGVR